MKKISCTAIYCFMLLSVQLQAQDVIKLATQNLFPYQKVGADGTVSGIAYDTVVCSLERCGHGYEIEIMPWARAQKMVESGFYDGFFSGAISPERDNYAVASSPLFIEEFRLYYLKNSEFPPLSETFKMTKKVAVKPYGAMQQWLTANHYQWIEKIPDLKNAFELLSMKRIDGVMTTGNLYEAYARDNKYNKLLLHVVPKTVPFVVYFSKDFVSRYPSFLPSFNKAINTCRSASSLSLPD